MLRKKLGLLALSFSIAATWGKIPTGNFSSMEIQPIEGMKLAHLAVIDDSEFSLTWVNNNLDYLKQDGVFVMVLGTEQESFSRMEQEYFAKGLRIGKAPEPEQLMEDVLKQMGITVLPVMIEGNIAWQVKPQ